MRIEIRNRRGLRRAENCCCDKTVTDGNQRNREKLSEEQSPEVMRVFVANK